MTVNTGGIDRYSRSPQRRERVRVGKVKLLAVTIAR